MKEYSSKVIQWKITLKNCFNEEVLAKSLQKKKNLMTEHPSMDPVWKRFLQMDEDSSKGLLWTFQTKNKKGLLWEKTS